jgi:hypothetical protein
LRAPQKTGSWIWPGELSPSVLAQIQVSFQSHYQFNDKKKRYYREMVHSGRYVDKPVCVGAKVISSLSTGYKYTFASGNIFNACDTCVQKHRLYAGIVRVDDELKMGIFPLPAGERLGIEWTDIAFWILN